MRLLLDTNALLGVIQRPTTLSTSTLDAITSSLNDVKVSAAAVWEIAIKIRTGKLSAPANLLQLVDQTGLPIRVITAEDGWRAGALPLLHKDPFDRVMVAQALIDGASLVTSDHKLADYGVSILPA